jgi:hypothetical protein
MLLVSPLARQINIMAGTVSDRVGGLWLWLWLWLRVLL